MGEDELESIADQEAVKLRTMGLRRSTTRKSCWPSRRTSTTSNEPERGERSTAVLDELLDGQTGSAQA